MITIQTLSTCYLQFKHFLLFISPSDQKQTQFPVNRNPHLIFVTDAANIVIVIIWRNLRHFLCGELLDMVKFWMWRNLRYGEIRTEKGRGTIIRGVGGVYLGSLYGALTPQTIWGGNPSNYMG